MNVFPGWEYLPWLQEEFMDQLYVFLLQFLVSDILITAMFYRLALKYIIQQHPRSHHPHHHMMSSYNCLLILFDSRCTCNMFMYLQQDSHSVDFLKANGACFSWARQSSHHHQSTSLSYRLPHLHHSFEEHVVREPLPHILQTSRDYSF